MFGLAAGVALASAACFATGSAVQHRVVSSAADDGRSSMALVAVLARRPAWLIGLALSAVAFGLHALALGLGELTVVQPVIVSGVVFAVLIRAGLDHRLPPARTLIWLCCTWGGLALFLAVRQSGTTAAPQVGLAAAFVGAGSVLGLLLAVGARAGSGERLQGLLFGAAAGVLFGLVAGLAKVVVSQLGTERSRVLLGWPVWALIVVGACAVLLNQRSYQATRLSLTAPMLNISQVVVALLFGVLVFHESPGGSGLVLATEVVGLGVVGLGIWKLASATPARSAERSAAGPDQRPGPAG